MAKIMNRVWLEIEHPRKDDGKIVKDRTAEQIDAIGNERASLASRMVERLGGSANYVFWHEKAGHYCFGGAMGYVEATDNGHWFNLDFFGRTDKPNPLDTDENIGSVA